MYRNIQSLYCVIGTNTVLFQVNYTSNTNSLIEKEIGFVVTRGEDGEKGSLMKVFKMHKLPVTRKISTGDITYNIKLTNRCMLYTKILRKESPKRSHHKKITFNFYTVYLYEMLLLLLSCFSRARLCATP